MLIMINSRFSSTATEKNRLQLRRHSIGVFLVTVELDALGFKRIVDDTDNVSL